MHHLVERLGLTLLQQMPPETAHDWTIRMLRARPPGRTARPPDPALSQHVLGMEFPTPLGMAAGFDKNGEVAGALFGLGFGFVEVGTTTPQPQAGNPKPRIFRLRADQGVINRLGFNNSGHAAMRQNLAEFTRRPGPLGINIGANKDSADRIADYALGVTAFADIADYFTVNISSPNTPGLRALQNKQSLQRLVRAVLDVRAASSVGQRTPVLLKIAPDVSLDQLTEIIEVVTASALDGLIISNTTLSRSGLASDNRIQSGGLSGRPLFHRATIVLAHARSLAGPDLPIIGVGGIDSAESAWQKIGAGANLLQVYSALTIHGPGLIASILDGLSAALATSPYQTIDQAVGHNRDEWCAQPFPEPPLQS